MDHFVTLCMKMFALYISLSHFFLSFLTYACQFIRSGLKNRSPRWTGRPSYWSSSSHTSGTGARPPQTSKYLPHNILTACACPTLYRQVFILAAGRRTSVKCWTTMERNLTIAPCMRILTCFYHLSLSITFRYHSWINSLFENILHELDEKFEVAEEDRDKTNFWLTVMASFGLLSIVCGSIGFVIMYIKCKKRPSRDWTEMDEFNRELPPNRRSSRVEDMNITVKREHN